MVIFKNWNQKISCATWKVKLIKKKSGRAFEEIYIEHYIAIIANCASALEHYTSILTCGKEELEQFYGREIILADREMVEQAADTIMDGAKAGIYIYISFLTWAKSLVDE